MSVNEAATGLGKQVAKTYVVFLIGIAVAVAGAAQIRFASLGPEWMPDEARRAYVEGLVLTGGVILWAVVTLVAGLIARALLPSVITLVAACVIFATYHGTTEQELLRPLFDEPRLSGFLEAIGALLAGPLLCAPLVGVMASRPVWRAVRDVVDRVPRKVRVAVVQIAVPVVALVVSDVAYASHLADEITEAEIDVRLPSSDSSWRVVPGTAEIDHVRGAEALGMYLARRDFTGIYSWATVRSVGPDPHADDPATVHYVVQNGEARFAVFVDQYGGAHPWPLDDRAEEDSSLLIDLETNLSSAEVDDLTRANCWACPG